MNNQEKQEVDIYIKVLKEYGYKLTDEYSSILHKNVLIYDNDKINGKVRIYFDFNTGMVTGLVLSPKSRLSDHEKEIRESIKIEKRNYELSRLII